MIVELHVVQNFAPSNLNRDDTGSPKDCEFGGYRRARISSQCLKRSIREQFKREELIPADRRADRTKRLVEALTERLSIDRDKDDAAYVARAAVGALGLKLEDDKTQYLLFLGSGEIARLAELCRANWDALGAPPAKAEGGQRKVAAVPADLANQFKAALDGGRAVDLALFGRMLADLPERNRDAASQVAHAISTNRVHMQFDYFTAVDDLNPDDTSGAGMIGTVEFNSACFYRYLNVDTAQLANNLDGDEQLSATALAAFLKAAIEAIPTGKQNSMAAQNPPSFVFAVVRDHGTWSLANAFVEPVSVDRAGLIANSIEKLDAYWGMLTGAYGDEGVRQTACFHVGNVDLVNLRGADVGSQSALVSRVMDAVQAN